jgi:hypothetical protein
MHPRQAPARPRDQTTAHVIKQRNPFYQMVDLHHPYSDQMIYNKKICYNMFENFILCAVRCMCAVCAFVRV